MPHCAMAQVGSALSASSNTSLRGVVPEGVLVAHAAVEAALRHLVARGLEMNAAELLVDVALREAGCEDERANAATPAAAASKDFRMTDLRLM